MSTRRFAQPWLLGIACAALAAAVVLPFTASPYAPPELLTALALVIGGLAGFLAGPLLGLVAVLAGLGSVAVVVDRPGRVALALPVGAAMALAAGLLGARFRRREQERALALTELSAIRETAAEAIVDLDRDGAITSWSPGAEAIYGYSADDVEGRPLSALAEEERVAEIGDLLEQVRDGTTVRRDIVQRRADGETFLASLTVAPLGNGSGEAGGAVAVAADIGERARAQQNAKEADSKYQTLVMRLPLVTYLYAALDRSTDARPRRPRGLGPRRGKHRAR